jgi:hypothetical protein
VSRESGLPLDLVTDVPGASFRLAESPEEGWSVELTWKAAYRGALPLRRRAPPESGADAVALRRCRRGGGGLVHEGSWELIICDSSAGPTFQLDPRADFDGDRIVRAAAPFPPLQSLPEHGWAAVPLWSRPAAGGVPVCEATFVQCLYFEVTVTERPKHVNGVELQPMAPEECIAIGLATPRFPFTGKQPGWTRDSCGYHSDDGNFFNGVATSRQALASTPAIICAESRLIVGSGYGKAYGPTYGLGDTVGCGICTRTQTVFFTKNGKLLGPALQQWIHSRELYPVIGVGSYCCCTVNVGDSPFQASWTD